MKNKKTEQTAARKKHQETLKSNRRKEPFLDRKEPFLDRKPEILIVCEGENTEPSYFNQFRLASATVKCMGNGFNTVSLVKQAIKLSKENKYEQVWCVFDKDDFKNKDFNKAITMADKEKFGIAYSNQAFEYWIILHFEDHQGGGMHRDNYNRKINSLLKPFKITYDGKSSKIITEEIFEVLEGIDKKTNKKRNLLAIERAKKIHEQSNHNNPALEESSTTVFKLVSELLKHI